MQFWTIDDVCFPLSEIEGGLLREIRPTLDAILQIITNLIYMAISIAKRLFPPLQVESDLMVKIDNSTSDRQPHPGKLKLANV